MRSKDDRISGTEDGRNPPLPNFTSGGSFYKPSLIAGANSVSPSFQGGGVSWRFRDKVSRLVGATWPTLNPKSPRDYPSWALRCCGGPPPSPLFQDLSREIHFRHPPPPPGVTVNRALLNVHPPHWPPYDHLLSLASIPLEEECHSGISGLLIEQVEHWWIIGIVIHQVRDFSPFHLTRISRNEYIQFSIQNFLRFKDPLLLIGKYLLEDRVVCIVVN